MSTFVRQSHKPSGDVAIPKSSEPSLRRTSASSPEAQSPELSSTHGFEPAREPPAGAMVQCKRTTSSLDDSFEREADEVADKVVRMGDPLSGALAAGIQRDAGGFEGRVSKAEATDHPPVVRADAGLDVDAAARGALRGGAPMSKEVRSYFEPRFGHDFSQVRVHTDGTAARAARGIGARAYTSGRDVVFGSGEYAPNSTQGRSLIAHELAHVVQQRMSGIPNTPLVQCKDANDATATTPKDKSDEISSMIEDMLPHKPGVVASIDRMVQLTEMFGKDLDALVREIHANAKAVAFVRVQGVSGILALADSRGPSGLDVAKAGKALADDEKRPKGKRLYERARFEAHPAPPKSLWFQQPRDNTNAIRDPNEPDPATAHLSDVVIDPRTFPIPLGDGNTLRARFAFPGSEANSSNGLPHSDVDRGEKLIIEAIRKIAGDLLSFPAAPNATVRRNDLMTRARLKEVLRNLNASSPLNIFIAPGGEEALKGLSFKTDQVFVRMDDMADPKKLEAAIRIPLVTLLGDPNGLASVPALTGDETGEGVLHEGLHALLIHRGASANLIWDELKGTLVDGPLQVQSVCEDVVHYSLLAQEESFVYNEVQKLGPAYAKFAPVNAPIYDSYIALVDAFFKHRGIKLDTRTRKLDVSERVGGKKVDWSISFHFPQKLTLTGNDLTPLNEILLQFPGR